MTQSADPDDIRWMRAALNMAGRALGCTWPNPAVGALIVKDGRVLGRGVTGKGGRPHAEVQALAMARERFGPQAICGASAYVTLEPCAHQGQTPPCADALIKAGIARVISPLIDPDPRVAGCGFARLRAAGVTVITDHLAAEASALNAGFLSRITTGRPIVTLKLATTIDGRIATAQGESRWISGAQSRRRVHLLRAQHDGVLIGAGTARSDDPLLDIRDLGLEEHNPVRIVTDSVLSLSPQCRLVQSAPNQPLWLLHAPGADKSKAAILQDAGIRLLAVALDDNGHLDIVQAVQSLGYAGLTRVLCEGGGRLAASLLRAGLVHQIVHFSAGKLIGAKGIASVADFGLNALADAPQFRCVQQELSGADIMTVWAPENG